jgi:hypothetical protein
MQKSTVIEFIVPRFCFKSHKNLVMEILMSFDQNICPRLDPIRAGAVMILASAVRLFELLCRVCRLTVFQTQIETPPITLLKDS